MDTPGVIQSIVLVVLIFLSAFFSSAETAFSTVNHVHIRTLAEEGNKKAVKVNKILDNYNKLISTILIGNNIVNIIAAALAVVLGTRLNVSVAVSTAIIILIILLFGEIIPKTWAKFYSEQIALLYGTVIYILMCLLTPVIVIIDFISDIFLKLFRIDTKQKINTMTEDELRTYVEAGHEDGVIESEEREMIYNVFDFADAIARDVMIPRINMVTININDSYEKVLAVFRETMYTRLPVYQEEEDNIIGLINVKDFILVTNPRRFSVRSILRKAYYTYEFKKTADLMPEMREKTANVAFVLNEYGATVGMITLEDLLEEIVGEIRDEYDGDEAERIKEIGERTYLVEGSMKLDDINDVLGTELDSENYDSIGGIIIENLDRLPEEDEEIQLENGIVLVVKATEQNRIKRVLLTLPEPPAETGDTEGFEEESDSTVQSNIGSLKTEE